MNFEGGSALTGPLLALSGSRPPQRRTSALGHKADSGEVDRTRLLLTQSGQGDWSGPSWSGVGDPSWTRDGPT